jgi:hypothetical protein
MRPEGITDRPVRPWELPGAFRRDCEPHRGPLVVFLGRAAFALSFVLAAIPLVDLPVLQAWRFPGWGLPLIPLAGTLPSLAVWALARHDLALIRGGWMDPAGESQVQEGWRHGAAGMKVAALSVALSYLLWAYIYRVY